MNAKRADDEMRSKTDQAEIPCQSQSRDGGGPKELRKDALTSEWASAALHSVRRARTSPCYINAETLGYSQKHARTSSLPISIELRSLFPMLPLGFVYCTLFQFAQVPALFWQAAASVPILVCE